MKKSALCLAFLLAGNLAAVAQPIPSQTPPEQEVRDITRMLLASVAKGDKAVWNRFVDESCLYTAEDGRTLTKSELLAEIQPLPPGYSGTLEMANEHVSVHGDVVIITYDAIETETVYGQELKARYHTTDVYKRRGDDWRIIATQVNAVPFDAKPLPVDPKVYNVLVGNYELAPGVRYVVKKEGDKLIGQRTGREPEELFPMTETVYFRKGTRGQKIFLKNQRGAITQMIDRRDNNDLVWKRVR